MFGGGGALCRADPKWSHFALAVKDSEGDEEEESGKDEAPEWSQQSEAANEKKGVVKESGGPYENGDDGRHEKS